jgi:pentatricopeptide repeat protein
MRAEGLAPSAVTYGCLLAACERTGDVSRAFQLYQQACAEVRFGCSYAELCCAVLCFVAVGSGVG